MTPVRLEPSAPQSRVKHSTTEPLCSLLFLSVAIFQPVGDDTEDCRIELEPSSGVLEPREEKSITVHFIANRTVGICVIEGSTFMQGSHKLWKS